MKEFGNTEPEPQAMAERHFLDISDYLMRNGEKYITETGLPEYALNLYEVPVERALDSEDGVAMVEHAGLVYYAGDIEQAGEHPMCMLTIQGDMPTLGQAITRKVLSRDFVIVHKTNPYGESEFHFSYHEQLAEDYSEKELILDVLHRLITTQDREPNAAEYAAFRRIIDDMAEINTATDPML